ncbi:hypothetical protein QFW77_04340 [Luteimonas sp. RD2P54]|uniref:Secreted protein n=1 Tax=Luteimonas endophytica TaxID=3042023 RepID=A0ABT6J7P0_9GAMM|nr:hypothetical protein [Luteimonas endophytica]MDH5822218.1 hypothetical protein [Luteimonas endophytica]
MRAFRLLTAVLLLACAAQALAQQSLRDRMTPQEFSAAGLDKLAPEELAALDAWLQRRVGEETAVAAEQAREEGRQEVVRKNRGFFHFDSEEPIEGTLLGEFTGFRKGERYTLDNGQVWEQTDPTSLPGVRRTDPKVTIRPGVFGAWWLQIDGYNTQAKVRRIE